jgi:putative PIN family toxin of toxin-antitoxin system
MVFLQVAARKSSVAGACFELTDQGHVRHCLSPPILAEIYDVSLRPEIRSRLPSLTETFVKDFLNSVRRFGTFYPAVSRHFAYSRDPKDEPYLNLAIEARARFLASRDNDILDLRSSPDPEAVDFRRRFTEIRRETPRDESGRTGQDASVD